MQHTLNTLSENIRAQSIELLNKQLASAIDLHAQVKQAHWNVRGPGFIGAHELFDKVAEVVEDTSDKIAERIGGLGGTAQGTLAVAAKHSFLVPYNLGIADVSQHIFAVASSLAAFSQALRQSITQTSGCGDDVTADLLTQTAREVEQQLWFVESHLKPTHVGQQSEQKSEQAA
ncbi:MAG: DNA starvation/stationary phase protection protein Dps [Alphaproteobacteria bacterium]|nr:DNA starvation/stationary phase protection protein Dps [Alphaproteobacteria bacterium]